jgi:hypothetical protein
MFRKRGDLAGFHRVLPFLPENRSPRPHGLERRCRSMAAATHFPRHRRVPSTPPLHVDAEKQQEGGAASVGRRKEERLSADRRRKRAAAPPPPPEP